MDRAPLESPAIVSLALFLGLNYLVGYDAGRAATGSAVGGVALALLMPFLSLLLLALPRWRITSAGGCGGVLDG